MTTDWKARHQRLQVLYRACSSERQQIEGENRVMREALERIAWQSAYWPTAEQVKFAREVLDRLKAKP